MKIATSFLAAVLFTGTLGALNNAIAEDGILSKDELAGTSYCHEKFPAIAPDTLGNDQPELKDSSTGRRDRLLRAVRRESCWEGSSPNPKAGRPTSLGDGVQ